MQIEVETKTDLIVLKLNKDEVAELLGALTFSNEHGDFALKFYCKVETIILPLHLD